MASQRREDRSEQTNNGGDEVDMAFVEHIFLQEICRGNG